MSISAKFFDRIRERDNWLEVFYYRERCLFNANGTDRENFLDQAHRLNDLLEQMSRKAEK